MQPTHQEFMKPPRTKPSLLFRLIVPATSVFIITILALIASVFGDPDAPVSRWLDRNGSSLLLGEFVAVVVLSILAMFVDRMRTLRGQDEQPIDLPPTSSSSETDAASADSR
ncbi:MAG: hypothetical protein Fues2KO_01780 [Fuerstiella sp.]